MAWTEQQQNAIDARNTSVIVSAAAGSGKTAVLTERLAQLLSDPLSGVRADRIIVVTFTNDAAAEMKKRLDMKLRQRINERPGDEYLLKQQALLQSARISTINSFCFELLRDNITDQGITSGFTVLDDTDNEVIRAQAMEELLDYYSKNEYEAISYLYDKFCLKDHKPLMKIISDTDRFLSSVAMADKWLDSAVSEYKKPFENTSYYALLFSSLLGELHTAARLAEENISLLPDIFPERSIPAVQKTFVQAQEDQERVLAMLRLAENRRFPTEEEKEFITGFKNLVTIKKEVLHNTALREVYKARRSRIKEILVSAVGGLSSAAGDFEESGMVTELLAGAVKKFRELVWERKCSRNAISFDDGERLALGLLADMDENGSLIQSETAKRTAEYYDIVMIDEYQDSNNKEDLIFKLLTRNYKTDSSGVPMYGDNAFLVGDVKQSIYRFRLANPRNFIATMKSSSPYSAESDSVNQYILLNKNFRSSPEVIDFINYVFSCIMSASCGDIDYNSSEMLYFGAPEYSSTNTSSRLTHINFINDDPEEDGELPETEVMESREAEITAEKIASMIKQGYPVSDKDAGERPCRAGDFCILVRGNRFTKAYVNALERRGISAKGSEEKGYLKSQEISVLTDLLRVIANPLLDVPLASVMVSPMYMFSVPELAYIKSFDNRKPLYPLLRSAACGEIDGFDAQLAVRCMELLDSIDRFRLDSITMTIGELIASIYDTTDFISVMQLYSDGEKKRANLRALIQYAQNYETSSANDGGGGLTGFIRHIDRILESGDYEQGKVSAASGDYVTVQTLHRSKGLEYPFVFIAETSSRFVFDSDPVMCSDDGRIGYILYDRKLVRRYRTFQQIMLQKEEQRDSRSEEMRLLYVGMTRAKQKLFINLSCGEKSLARVCSMAESCVIDNSDISGLVSAARSFSDWIWLCLMVHSSFPDIAEKLGIAQMTLGLPAHEYEEQLFEYELCGLPEIQSVMQDEGYVKAEADSSIVKNITDMIEHEYDDSLSNMTAKLSVTQITRKLRDDEEFDFRLQRPKFIAGSRTLTGAERGTAIHTFFQYCDFVSASAYAELEISRMSSLGYLTAAQAECISPEKVKAFFRSGLYKKISSAKSYKREKKFMVAAGELALSGEVFDRLHSSDGMIKGIIDLMYEDEDGIVIVDYKSDRGLSADELRERYMNQLMIYKAAIELTSEKRVKGLSLYSIELEKEIVLLSD